jgi:tetratricopeptide (TPR) repeat protein
MTVVKIVIAVVGLGAAGYFAYDAMQDRQDVAEYNRIVEEYYNKQKFEKAAAAFEDLLTRAEGSLKEEVRSDLVDTYKHLGDDPGRSTRESAEWYRKAVEIDPDCLNRQQKRTMQIYENQRDSEKR